jgi:hypothetical protein
MVDAMRGHEKMKNEHGGKPQDDHRKDKDKDKGRGRK